MKKLVMLPTFAIILADVCGMRAHFLEKYNLCKVSENVLNQTSLCVKHKKENIMKYITEFNADIDEIIELGTGETLLFNACEQGNKDMVKFLIEQGTNVDITNNLNKNPLDVAYNNKHKSIMKCLIECGANINRIINTEGDTLLFDACEQGNKKMVKFLVEHGANVNITNNLNKNPLDVAFDNKHENIMKYLMKHGGQFYNETNELLFLACQYGNEEMLKSLTENNADIGAKNWQGYTPLRIAYENNKVNIVKYLVKECNADINEVGSDGNTLLFLACLDNNFKFIECFTELGADVNKETAHGQTPLITACRYNNIKIVKHLVEHGADVRKKNKHKESPLSVAIEKGHEDIKRYLKNHGAKEGLFKMLNRMLKKIIFFC